MVGPAYTLRYIPAREDLDHLGVFEDRGHPAAQGRRGMPGGPCVRDRQPPQSVGRLRRRHPGDAAVEARRGRHRHRRRLPRHARDRASCRFPPTTPAPAAPTNLIKHHAVDLNVPVACGEVPVYPGRHHRRRRRGRRGRSRSTSPKRSPRRRSSRPPSRTSCRRRSWKAARSSASIRRLPRRARSSSNGARRKGAETGAEASDALGPRRRASRPADYKNERRTRSKAG